MKPVGHTLPRGQQNLVTWATPKLNEDKVRQCVDTKLGGEYPPKAVAKDPRFERLLCTHKGTYADDCLVERVTQHKCFIVATCDRYLKRRIRKIPGVPMMYITKKVKSVID